MSRKLDPESAVNSYAESGVVMALFKVRFF
jgi:hypothetical protein